MQRNTRWARIACAVLLLIGFGACLVHLDEDGDDHGLPPHACAAMLLVVSVVALTTPTAGPRVRIESPSAVRQARLQPLDPPPKALPLA
jgi:hypothetical protein